MDALAAAVAAATETGAGKGTWPIDDRNSRACGRVNCDLSSLPTPPSVLSDSAEIPDEDPVAPTLEIAPSDTDRWPMTVAVASGESRDEIGSRLLPNMPGSGGMDESSGDDTVRLCEGPNAEDAPVVVVIVV